MVFGNVLDSTEIYDPITNSWSTGPNIPHSMYCHCLVYIGSNDALLIGGAKYPDTTTTYATVYKINPSGLVETKMAMSEPRALSACEKITLSSGNEVVIVAGGVSSAVIWHIPEKKSTFFYSISSNSWTEGPELVLAAQGLKSTVLDGKMRVFGGVKDVSTSRVTSVYELSADGTSWQEIPGLLLAVINSETNWGMIPLTVDIIHQGE